MTRKQLEQMSCDEIAALLDEQKTDYAREIIVEQLTSARFYDRAVYHAAMGFRKTKAGHRSWVSVNQHLDDGIIDESKTRRGKGWATQTKRRPFKRGGRGASKAFKIKGSEIKRILLKDGPVPANGIMEVSK